jgi:hypothetical protein
VPLFRGEELADKEAGPYFQMGLSHDGKTAAVVTTYLMMEKENQNQPENCALALVDLSSPGRKVTRVPIPLPKKRD